ncbi:MAG: O-antigen ligase family protein [Chloroflexi bacterium]|nr:O-antigen ligase family protein [Chloroflexota bacterium]
MKQLAVSRQRSAFSVQHLAFLLGAVLLGLGLARLPLLWAAGIVGGTAVFLIILIYPWLGLGLALLLGPLGALESALGFNSPLDSGQLALTLTLAVWLGRGLRRRQIIIPRLFLNIPLLIFLFVAALTLINATSLPIGFKELLKWVEILLIMWLVAEEGGRGNRISHFLWMLLLAGVVQALVGIWQFGLRGDGPEHFLVLGRFYRAYGTFEQPNPFGGFMNLTALLALGAFVGLFVSWLHDYRQTRKDSASPFHLFTLSPLLFVGGIAMVTAVALIASWSRGAWLGFGAGTAVLAFFLPTKRWQGVAMLGLGMGLLLLGLQFNLIPASVTERVASFNQDLQFGDVRGVDINDANYAVLERLAHWQAALGMARDNLWLGVGFGNYEPVYPDYDLINWPAPLGHAHNYYLNLLAETGVLGLAAYLLLWTAVFWQTIRLLNRLHWPQRGIALGLLAAWTSLTVHHLVDKLYVNNIYIHLGVMLGLLQLLERATSSKFPDDSADTNRISA